MWNPLTKNRGECNKFRESLEDVASGDALPAGLREHAAACPDCEAAAGELVASRELLSALPSHAETARPWLAPRVMAAIAARESELRQSLDAWTIVPKLAARLTWLSALALVLASTWLLERPASIPLRNVPTDITGEPVQQSAPPVNNDETLLSLAEKAS